MIPLLTTLSVLAIATSALPSPSSATTAATPAFTYNASTFLLHGEPFQIIGGQMDPQRIPYRYWRDRLAKARAIGLNTIFSYVFWDWMEPKQGQWTGHQPENDIAAYFRIAQEEGLHVVLRPGPYICGEHEWGGFPAWLSEVSGLVVRAYNEPYLNASQSYLERLADDLQPLQVTNGGPLLMVQVENEYGSFGEDHRYIAALRDTLRQIFDVPLYTNDGGVDWTLEGGSIPGVLAEVDGDPSSGFNARNLYINDTSEFGPLLDGEYYTWAPDQWGSENPHNTTVGNLEDVQQFVKDIDYVLGNMSASISFYMVHGGTNFGFGNGALWQNRTTVFTSSYDYGAPIDESGRTTELYHTIRNTISRYVASGSIPEIPADLPRMSIPEFELKPMVPLFNTLGEKVTSDSPMTMEAVGQSYGFILYEHTVDTSVTGMVQPGDRPRDRVIIYVNDVRQGVMDSQYQQPLNVSVSLEPGDKLQLFVENLGRVDYYSRGNPYADYLRQPHKGIVGEVTVGGQCLNGWDMYALPVNQLPSIKRQKSSYTTGGQRPETPLYYHGTFNVSANATDDPATLDTYLAVPNGIKGNIFINGFNLGRYWLVVSVLPLSTDCRAMDG